MSDLRHGTTRLSGRLEWRGGDPDVVELQSNGKRQVMLRLSDGDVDISVPLKDAEKLVRAIQVAQVWVREG